MATPKRPSRKASRPQSKPAQAPPSKLKTLVRDLAELYDLSTVDEYLDQLTAYAVCSEGFQRENDYLPRMNYMAIARHTRKIIIEAYKEHARDLQG
mgnify:CR=1 FL=1